MDTALSVDVRPIDAAATRDLRTRVLRNHIPGLAATAPNDNQPGTVHLGAFVDGQLLGVVTTFADELPGAPGLPAQRFRFMAVEPAVQGAGVGTALMAAVTDHARSAGACVLWANGRDSALGFYAGLGFREVGERFDDGVTGLPHHVVVQDL